MFDGKKGLLQLGTWGLENIFKGIDNKAFCKGEEASDVYRINLNN